MHNKYYLNILSNIKSCSLLLFYALFLLAFPLSAYAASTNGVALKPNAQGVYEIPLYKSGVIRLDRPAGRVSVGNPGIADIQVFQVQELYVVGKQLGSTNITVWGGNGQVFKAFNVEVTHDLETLKYKLHTLLPGENIRISSAQERIVLSGEVSNLTKMSAAVELADSFLPDCIAPESNITVTDTTQGKAQVSQQTAGGSQSGDCKEGSVVNMMQVGGSQQVMLEVKVAEISRSLIRKLDGRLNLFSFGDTAGGLVSGGASFPNVLTPEGELIPLFADLNQNGVVGPPADWFDPNTPGIEDTGAFLSHLTGDLFLQAMIGISKENGLAKILAEPTLTALSGQQAEFLSGGEFPIPVNGDDGTVTIVFKEFGVGLKVLPVVLDSGHVNLKLNVDVSELSQENSFEVSIFNTNTSLIIPSLTKRSAKTAVELGDGQTIGIAGLINDSTRAVVDRLPGLGDIPVLGTLFKSQEFVSGQTELVIFVTPRLAKPIAQDKIKLPTDNFVPPTDLEFYLLGKLEGSDSGSGTAAYPEYQENKTTSVDGGLDGGKYGHSL